MEHYIGIDIGGTKCAITLGYIESAAEKMVVQEKYKFETCNKTPFQILNIFKDKIEEYKNLCDVSGIGISCGGPLNSAKGVILSPPNLPGWDNIEIVKYFNEKFKLPVYLQNDANACAVAEWKYGAGIGYDNVVFMTFGTGLGAGLILNGKLYTGTNDMAGEVGHVRLSDEGPSGYGKAGSFEGFCSGGGIAQLAQAKVKSGEYPKLLEIAGSIENINAKLVGDLAESGDEFCKEIYAYSGRMLGKGLSIIIDILNPQVVIIGGIFSRSRGLLWEYAKEVIEHESLGLSAGVCKVVASVLGERIGDIAALSVATGKY
jgi:glucokinase